MFGAVGVVWGGLGDFKAVQGLVNGLVEFFIGDVICGGWLLLLQVRSSQEFFFVMCYSGLCGYHW